MEDLTKNYEPIQIILRSRHFGVHIHRELPDCEACDARDDGKGVLVNLRHAITAVVEKIAHFWTCLKVSTCDLLACLLELNWTIVAIII